MENRTLDFLCVFLVIIAAATLGGILGGIVGFLDRKPESPQTSTTSSQQIERKSQYKVGREKQVINLFKLKKCFFTS